MGSWRLNPYKAKARLSEQHGRAEARRQQPAEAQAGGPGPGAPGGDTPGDGDSAGGEGGGQVGGRRVGPSLSTLSPTTEGDSQHVSLCGL